MYAIPEVIPRTGITAADSSIGSLPVYGCQGSGVVRLGAVCSQASATLTCRVIFFDGQGQFIAGTTAVQFTSDSGADDGSLYIGVPSADAWFPSGGAYSYAVKVDAVSAGTWTLTQMAC